MATLAGHSGGELEELRDEVNKFKEESEKVRRLCYLLTDHSYLTFIFLHRRSWKTHRLLINIFQRPTALIPATLIVKWLRPRLGTRNSLSLYRSFFFSFAEYLKGSYFFLEYQSYTIHTIQYANRLTTEQECSASGIFGRNDMCYLTSKIRITHPNGSRPYKTNTLLSQTRNDKMLRLASRSLFTKPLSASTRSLATATSSNVVNIVEVGPRDGLQNEKGSIVPVDLKVQLIDRLVKAGVTNVEAGSFVSPKWVPQAS